MSTYVNSSKKPAEAKQSEKKNDKTPFTTIKKTEKKIPNTKETKLLDDTSMNLFKLSL